jgi:sarcosine oxidase
LWREIERETGKQILVTTSGLILSSRGKNDLTHGANFFQNTVEAARKFKIEHELLTAAQIRVRFPQFNVNDDEQGYFEVEAGFVRPEEAIAAQLELARKYGATIRTGEIVLSHQAKAGKVRVSTNHGEYAAKRLIIAAGSWLPQLIEAELGQYFQVFRQVLYWFDAKESIKPYMPGNFPVFIWELRGSNQLIYGFPALDEKGGVKIATEQFQVTTTPGTVDRNVTGAEIQAMYENLVKPNIPGLSDDCIKATTCLYTVTPDFGFVIDQHPNHENVLIASPCSGHGFKHSAAIGEVLAQLIVDGKSSIDIRKFSMRRFV